MLRLACYCAGQARDIALWISTLDVNLPADFSRIEFLLDVASGVCASATKSAAELTEQCLQHSTKQVTEEIPTAFKVSPDVASYLAACLHAYARAAQGRILGC